MKFNDCVKYNLTALKVLSDLKYLDVNRCIVY